MNPEDLEVDGDGEVQLYVYDMSKGLANSLSQMVLGQHIEGIWHSGIVAYGREYFYGGAGIESCRPGGTVLGQPNRVLKLGVTEVPYSLFLEYVFGLGESTYRPGTYDLFKHNCNIFSNEMAVFLTGKSIPEYITSLPENILSTPLGESLRPLIESLSLRAEGSRGVSFGARAQDAAEKRFTNDLSGGGEISFREESPTKSEQIKESRENPIGEESQVRAKQIAAKDQTKLKENRVPPTPMADASNDEMVASTEIGSAEDRAGDGEESSTPKKEKKPREPPIVFTDINAAEAFENITKHLKELLGEEEQQLLTELSDFVLADTGAWALGAQHLQMIGRLLQDSTVPKDGQLALLRFLQAAALKDDIILLLHMDRKDHILMNYINEFEKMDPDTQEELATLLVNLCQPATASDWLLYISEWQQGGQPCSNGRVTTRVAVNSLLHSRPSLQEKGVTLMYNLGLKEVFDDTATELASAILQHLHGDLSEDHAFKLLNTLLHFMVISYNDVPALVKMLGPDLNKFKGKSTRIDELLEPIQFKLSMVVAL